MPTRSNIRLSALVVVASAVAAAGWVSRDRPVVLTPRRAAASLPTGRQFDRPAPVRLQALSAPSSPIDDSGRDPFSATPGPVVLVPPALPRRPPDRVDVRETPNAPPVASAPFKFMGVLQKRTGERWGVFADCAGYTRAVREGESVLGTWRVVRLGIESVFVESLDGRQLTMPLAGCGPRTT